VATTTTARRLRPRARGLAQCLREFLTPAAWKQAQAARGRSGRRTRRPPRWQTQPLVLTLVLLTWCCGDSQAERFETAKAACAACLSKRRRPGRTAAGFHKALARLPLAVLRAVAAGVRRRLRQAFDLATEGFVVMGCDGSLLECPRAAELERRLGDRGKARSAPALWLTALVHLRTGLLWSWRLGKGTAAERRHLAWLLPTLPAGALVVADAGFSGYGLARAILAAKASFLIRASGKDFFYADGPVQRRRWRDGEVWAWPQVARDKGQPPLRLRLVRVRRRKGRQDVWLLTDVLDRGRLPAATAARYYRWRWESEGLFRTYKRTLAKVKLHSRTVRLVHREAEGALLGTQLLLAQGARALPRRSARRRPVRCSPRAVLREIRRELQATAGARRRSALSRRLARARREQRRRASAKERRAWPRRVPHKAPKPPQFLTLTEEQKALRDKLERESG
jgi:Transposase DDE domain